MGLGKKLKLGNLEAKRDWGHAREYVKAMWLMLQQDQPDDYVVATGETHSVEDFARLAFECVNLDYREHVEIDQNLFRPAEVCLLLGDCSKARHALKWSYPLRFEDLVQDMIRKDFEYFSSAAFNPNIAVQPTPVIPGAPTPRYG